MRCKRCIGKLSQYIDDNLNEKETLAIRKHLEGCSSCSAYFQKLTKSIAQLKLLKQIEVSANFPARLSWRLDHEISCKVTNSVRYRFIRRVCTYTAIAAGILYLLLSVIPKLSSPTPTEVYTPSKESNQHSALSHAKQEKRDFASSPDTELAESDKSSKESAPAVPPPQQGLEIPIKEVRGPENTKREDSSIKTPAQQNITKIVDTSPVEIPPALENNPPVSAIDLSEKVAQLEHMFSEASAAKNTTTLIEIVRKVGQIDTTRTYIFLKKILSPENAFDRELRKEALFSLSTLGTKDAVKIALLSLSDEDWEVRDSVPLALSKIEKKDGVYFLANEVLPTAKSPETRSCVAWALGRVKPDFPIEFLSSAYRNEKNPKVRYAICEAIGRRQQEDVEDALLNALSDSTWYVRDVALTGLARVGTSEAVEHIISCLHDQNLLVRESAAVALSKTLDVRAIAPLVRTLRTKDKRLYGTVLTTLVKITGKDFATEAEWRKWLKSVGDNPELEPNPQASAPATAYFCGLPIRTNSVIFLIDCSSSMNLHGKFQAAKDELKKTIELLETDVLFNIIFFNSSYTRYFSPQQLTDASEENKRKAAKFIDAAQTVSFGGKNLYDQLAKCLAYEPDDIFILTDSVPSEGKYTSPAKIILEISKLNLFQKTRINTIGFFSSKEPLDMSKIIIPVGPPSDLLRGLAEENYGTYIYRWFFSGESSTK